MQPGSASEMKRQNKYVLPEASLTGGFLGVTGGAEKEKKEIVTGDVLIWTKPR